MNKIAFFDVDYTLIDGSTGLCVLYQLWHEKTIPLKEIQKGVYYTILYKLNVLPYEKAITVNDN